MSAEETASLSLREELEADARAERQALLACGADSDLVRRLTDFIEIQKSTAHTPAAAGIAGKALATVATPSSTQWCILSQVNLADSRDTKMIETLFTVAVAEAEETGEPLPAGFIFLGDFEGTDLKDDKEGGTIKEGLSRLFLLLSTKFRQLATHCYFVFVPGPNDPCFAREALPRLPISPVYTQQFVQQMQQQFKGSKDRIFFSTSPCRIRHLNCLMTFFRHDIYASLSSECLLTGGLDENNDIKQNLHKIVLNTIMGQAHLCPCRADHRLAKPRDASLSLMPTPNLASPFEA
ncbi:DNA polymerase epsilon subunit b [Cyclospora cayetanensis]|uniref:DNA polymerase II subunit 2 n=1 Tax=Cyclospora cayetanensis TaxID=88456 RepID=A0A1D3D8J1_9EIME|nr:DNA polymerase epsilon subunit b [Cyclospora cayetanensis]